MFRPETNTWEFLPKILSHHLTETMTALMEEGGATFVFLQRKHFINFSLKSLQIYFVNLMPTGCEK